MGKKKISEFNSATPASGDKFLIEQPDGTYKKVDFDDLGSGVQSVTGPNVDNTDPNNPIVNVSTLQEVVTKSNVLNGVLAQTADVLNYILVDNGQVLLRAGDGVTNSIIDVQTGSINLQAANVQKNGVEIATTTDVNLKSNTASPTFTGTVTTPSIIVSSETASRVAIIDASKNVKSADTATYPSLAELAYIKGLTSNIQTQLDGKRYTIPFNAINFNPADATTYYFGGFFSAARANGRRRWG